jgi:arabinofuranosyltransferase
MKPGRGTSWVLIALLLPAGVVLLAHAWHYLPFISDDALISLRYAERLQNGHGLTWTDGRPVEGYSNLLWILLLTLAGLCGMDLVHAARMMGLLGMAAIMFALARWYVAEYPIKVAWFAVVLALLFLSLSAPIAVWAIGGLEQPLVGALLALSIPLTFALLQTPGPARPRILWLSLVLGLLCLSRPDGPLFSIAAGATLLVSRRSSSWSSGVRDAFVVQLFPVVLTAVQAIFRIAYYGEIVPNTALVKFSPSYTHWAGGVAYVAGGLQALAPFSWLSVVSLVALLLSARTRNKAVYLAALALGWSSYIVLIGGDIFPAYRHFVPLIVVFAFALAETAIVVASRLIARPPTAAAAMAVVLVLFLPFTARQFADKQSRRATTERWEWQGRSLGLLLKKAFSPQQPLLAVTAAGCLPYWSQLPSLDMLGLNDYYLPRHPPSDIGRGMLGHELGDGPYVLGRKPDIIVFSVGAPPSYRSGDELNAMPEFHDRYVAVTVSTKPSEEPMLVYFDRYSDRIGTRRSATTIAVPGFLLTGTGVAAHADRRDQLVARIPPGASAGIEIAADTEGWSVDHVRASSPETMASLSTTDRGLRVAVQSHAATPVDVEEVVLKRR